MRTSDLESRNDPAMTDHTSVWEYGSEFHWPASLPVSDPEPTPWGAEARFVGSGRDGLRFLLEMGMAERNWRRLLIPSYFCPHVTASLVASGIEVATYPHRPPLDEGGPTEVDAGATDVVLNVNLFGLLPRSPLIVPEGVDVIEDHTHDPWSEWAFQSAASFAVASFRKVLPVPTGGVVWSPAGVTLPSQPEVSRERQLASDTRMRAMVLKSLYLTGHRVSKPLFRSLADFGEQRVSPPPVSGMPEGDRALLDLLPWAAWRNTRLQNHRLLSSLLGADNRINVLQPADFGSVPLSVVMLFEDNHVRTRVRDHLIANDVYPAILWDVRQAPPVGVAGEDVAVSERILSLHIDYRYGRADIEKVGDFIRAAV